LSARKSRIPENYVQRVIQLAQQGYSDIELKPMIQIGTQKPI